MPSSHFQFNLLEHNINWTNFTDLYNIQFLKDTVSYPNDFFGYSNLIKIVSNQINHFLNNNNANGINYQFLTFINLNEEYTKLFCSQLNIFGIKYDKIVQRFNLYSISIDFKDIWSIEDYTLQINNIIFPTILFDNPTQLYNFYSSFTILHRNSERKLIVSLNDYIKFRRYLFPTIDIYFLYNNFTTPYPLLSHSDILNFEDNIHVDYDSDNHSDNHSDNLKSQKKNNPNFKHTSKLANLIFDIKEKISDAEYLELMDTISLIN